MQLENHEKKCTMTTMLKLVLLGSLAGSLTGRWPEHPPDLHMQVGYPIKKIPYWKTPMAPGIHMSLRSTAWVLTVPAVRHSTIATQRPTSLNPALGASIIYTTDLNGLNIVLCIWFCYQIILNGGMHEWPIVVRMSGLPNNLSVYLYIYISACMSI